MARELNTRERQLCVTIAEQKPSRRATQRHPASEPVILIWIPGRCPSSSTECPPSTHVDRGREVPDDREFPRGTFSQAELTDERVITRQHLTASASASHTLFNRCSSARTLHDLVIAREPRWGAIRRRAARSLGSLEGHLPWETALREPSRLVQTGSRLTSHRGGHLFDAGMAHPMAGSDSRTGCSAIHSPMSMSPLKSGRSRREVLSGDKRASPGGTWPPRNDGYYRCGRDRARWSG